MVFPVVGGDGKPTGYNIANSLRFEDGGSPYLTHTRGTATNEKKFTFSTWIKLGKAGVAQNGTLFGSGDDGNGYAGDMLAIQTNGLIKQGDHDGSTDNHNVRTNAILRDSHAWYHIVCAADSTQGTASNRIKLYINGTQQTGLAASTYPSQDITFDCNTNGQVLNIGRNQNGENHVYFDGYMAETVFIDGQQLTPSSFGETDDNGVWIPKDISAEGLTFGNNGFYLEYKQTGTSADASGKGADTSGEGTHFDDNGMTAEDITTDTPTNNFCVLNNLDANRNDDLSEGNTQYVSPTSARENVRGTFGVTSGKWYYEVKQTTSNGATNVGVSIEGANLDDSLGKDNFGWAYQSGGTKRHNNSAESYGNTYTGNDIIGVALNLDDHELFFYKNGTAENSGTKAYDLDTGETYFPMFGSGALNSTDTFQANFGNAPFSISSGNADANGYGNFEYAPPSGYYSLCTKNLAEYG